MYVFSVFHRKIVLLLTVCSIFSTNIVGAQGQKPILLHNKLQLSDTNPKDHEEKPHQEGDSNMWLNAIEITPKKKKKIIIPSIEETPSGIQYLKIRTLDGILKTINSFNTKNTKMYKISGGVAIFLIMTFILNGLYPGEKNVNKLVEKYCVLQ
jgi:hypothetical protein